MLLHPLALHTLKTTERKEGHHQVLRLPRLALTPAPPRPHAVQMHRQSLLLPPREGALGSRIAWQPAERVAAVLVLPASKQILLLLLKVIAACRKNGGRPWAAALLLLQLRLQPHGNRKLKEMNVARVEKRGRRRRSWQRRRRRRRRSPCRSSSSSSSRRRNGAKAAATAKTKGSHNRQSLAEG